MQFLENLWKIWKNMEILDLPQKKEKETIWCWNQIMILQNVPQKVYQEQKQHKKEILTNKNVYLGLLVLVFNKT